MSDGTRLNSILDFVVSAAAFVISVGLSVAIAFLIRQPLVNILTKLLDEDFAKLGLIFAWVLIGLAGLSTAFSFVTWSPIQPLLRSIIGPLNGAVDSLKWIVWITALLFIGYSIRAGSDED
ncbi:MAG: hypothetical protein SVX38_01070 [Chloroflexota bacterium]|nr:hypothetical protein [Chloroflexota bacterium]